MVLFELFKQFDNNTSCDFLCFSINLSKNLIRILHSRFIIFILIIFWHFTTDWLTDGWLVVVVFVIVVFLFVIHWRFSFSKEKVAEKFKSFGKPPLVSFAVIGDESLHWNSHKFYYILLLKLFWRPFNKNATFRNILFFVFWTNVSVETNIWFWNGLTKIFCQIFSSKPINVLCWRSIGKNISDNCRIHLI